MSRFDSGKATLNTYPYSVCIAARYADLDVLGHVNNIAIAEMFEEARASFLRTIFSENSWFRGEGRVMTVRVATDYLREVSYPGEYRIGVGVSMVGKSSASISAALFGGEHCSAMSESVLVHVGNSGPAGWTESDRGLLTSPRWMLRTTEGTRQ